MKSMLALMNSASAAALFSMSDIGNAGGGPFPNPVVDLSPNPDNLASRVTALETEMSDIKRTILEAVNRPPRETNFAVDGLDPLYVMAWAKIVLEKYYHLDRPKEDPVRTEEIRVQRADGGAVVDTVVV